MPTCRRIRFPCYSVRSKIHRPRICHSNGSSSPLVPRLLWLHQKCLCIGWKCTWDAAHSISREFDFTCFDLISSIHRFELSQSHSAPSFWSNILPSFGSIYFSDIGSWSQYASIDVIPFALSICQFDCLPAGRCAVSVCSPGVVEAKSWWPISIYLGEIGQDVLKDWRISDHQRFSSLNLSRTRHSFISCLPLTTGIFAYLNYLEPKTRREILEFLIKGLQRLEYRGYDSAGVAIDGPAPGSTQIIRRQGKVKVTKGWRHGIKYWCFGKLVMLIMDIWFVSNDRYWRMRYGI